VYRVKHGVIVSCRYDNPETQRYALLLGDGLLIHGTVTRARSGCLPAPNWDGLILLLRTAD